MNTKPVAFTTGAGSGLGRAITHQPAADGTHVAVADISERGGIATVGSISDAGGTASSYRLDVSDEPAVAAVIDEIAVDHGRIDHAVSTAGILGEHGTHNADYHVAGFDHLIAISLGKFSTASSTNCGSCGRLAAVRS